MRNDNLSRAAYQMTLNAAGKKQHRNWKRIGWAVWSILFALLLAMHWYPIRFGMLRLLMVVCIVLLWAGGLWLVWSHKIVRRVLMITSAVLIVFLLLPARSPNPEMLRREYVNALKSYEGTPYVWGGETKRGIDCSGLMRCALIDVNFKLGLMTLNPSLVREGISLWWNDCSAKALKEEHQQRTNLLLTAPDINSIDYSSIVPGDMAVTSSGVHVLAYVGNETWIEADPNEIQGNKVIQVKTPTANAWFKMPVHIMRWRQLESGDLASSSQAHDLPSNNVTQPTSIDAKPDLDQAASLTSLRRQRP